MNHTKLTENLTQVTKLGWMNAYLVREDDGLTLVDTTMNAADQLIAAAEQLGTPIRRIALTHGHGDHVGSLDALREKLGADCRCLITELDAKILAGEEVEFSDKNAAAGRRSRPRLTCCCSREIASAASRSSRAPVIRRERGLP